MTKTKIFNLSLALLITSFCLLAILTTTAKIGVANYLSFTSFLNDPVPVHAMAEVNCVPDKGEREWSVKEKIKYYSEIFDVNTEDALRIAQCESNLNPKAENVNGSATGVYQFIRKTFKNYCDGDVYNADANIICFMRMYPEHKDWWECN